MVKYLLDTNIISGYISQKYSSENMKYIGDVIDGGSIISVITKIEILSWKTEKNIENLLKEFVETAETISLDNEVCDIAVSLRRKHKIKTPDAIIASTAVAHQLILITENDKDFANIKGLKVKNPITVSL
ncbi:MAG: type II toxin-antitoxin system VapC family toxin [Cloacibacterium sp.]|nr:type II toxin-antitoxin system VapC family toxin [Cloacibacterium sp.]